MADETEGEEEDEEEDEKVKEVFDHLSDHHQLGAENPVDEEKLQTSDHEGTKYEAVG